MTQTLQTATLFGYPIHPVTLDAGLRSAEAAIAAGDTMHVVTLNPEMLMQAEQDVELGLILRQSGLSLPDGAGVVWALKTRGHRQVQRLPGIEFSESLLALAADKQYRVAIIGARPEVLETAIARLKERYPALNLVFEHHGFFSSLEEEGRIAQQCAAASPQVVLVALGVPRQEKWISRFGPLFRGAVLVGVGGSLDVWAGAVQRAPRLYRSLNLEWLYRVMKEPWRLKRIYKTLPLFVVKVLVTPNRSTSDRGR